MNAGSKFREASAKFRQATLMDLFVAIAFRNLLGAQTLASRKVPECSHQALKLQQVRVLFRKLRLQGFGAMLEHSGILLRSYGKAVVAIPDIELPPLAIKEEFQFTAFQHCAVVVMQYRD